MIYLLISAIFAPIVTISCYRQLQGDITQVQRILFSMLIGFCWPLVLALSVYYGVQTIKKAYKDSLPCSLEEEFFSR